MDLGILTFQVTTRDVKRKQVPIEPLGLGLYGHWVDDGRRIEKQHDDPNDDVVRVHTDEINGHWELFSFSFQRPAQQPELPTGRLRSADILTLMVQVPTVGGTRDKNAIKDFQNAFNEAVVRLLSDDCAKLFGGKDAAYRALFGANYRYADLKPATKNPDTGAISATGAATFTNTRPQSVSINNYGPFRNTSVLVSTSGGTQSHTFDFGTHLRGAQFGALLLLHELGHLTGIFGPDANDAKKNREYTQRVQDACFPGNK
jgi:hypothetical protein